MNADTVVRQPDRKSDTTGGILKPLLRYAVFLLILPAALFISSGRLDWVLAWVFIGVLLTGAGLNTFIMIRKNPGLFAERSQTREGAKTWDKVLSRLMGVFGSVGMLVIAGLDVRFGWSPQIPLVLQIAALVTSVLGYVLTSWAMASNRFFSAVVRIQTDRGHTVVSSGPYQLVRHPGYAGGIICTLTMPIILSSLWAFILVGLLISTYIVRTALEDRTLQNELDGYKEYAQQVRYRLLPRIW